MRKDCDDDQCEECEGCMPYDDDDVDWGGGSHKRQETCCWICAVSRWDFLPQTIQDFFSVARKRCSRGSSRSSKYLYSSSEKESQDNGSPHH